MRYGIVETQGWEKPFGGQLVVPFSPQSFEVLQAIKLKKCDCHERAGVT
jgi:hypothetical protein